MWFGFVTKISADTVLLPREAPLPVVVMVNNPPGILSAGASPLAPV